MTERKVFTELSGAHSGELNDALGRIGFRRSQNVAYRPSCTHCASCVSVWDPLESTCRHASLSIL